MAVLLGATKSKNNNSQIIKSLKTIISELNKLEKTGGFKGVYVDSSYFNFLQSDMESALKKINK
jgi:hypothetical protein